jgi:hypothetical protein
MPERGTRGAYRKEDRVQLPAELQKELVEKAAAKYGNCQELAKHLNIPKSSVHYYRIGRLTMPISVMEQMLEIAGDQDLRERAAGRGIAKDRTRANEYAVSIYREMCRDRLRLPTKEELETNGELRRKAAALTSYVLAEGSIWVKSNRYDEGIVNITFADHEDDLYNHFRSLCQEVFQHDMGPPQPPGNGAKAIRGFIYSTFIAQWLNQNGIPVGDKSSQTCHLPKWVLNSTDSRTWMSAIQPWCDGEGSVKRNSTNRVTGFSISQSRHTDIDLLGLPIHVGWRGKSRHVSTGVLQSRTVFEIPAIDFITAFSRSEVLDDVATLLRRLAFSPRVKLNSAYLKDDGFWSANWDLALPKRDCIRLLEHGLVIQDRKRKRLESTFIM